MSTVVEHKTDVESTSTPVSQLRETAETIRNGALERARLKLSALLRQKSLEELLYRHDFIDIFKYELACAIAQVVSANDKRITEVYAFDPSANPDAELGEYLPLDVTLHILVRVDTPSAALEAFFTSLDRALIEYLKELPSSSFAERTSIIDPIIISEEEVKMGRGYAKALTSVFAPPLKIWERSS